MNNVINMYEKSGYEYTKKTNTSERFLEND